MSLKIQPAKMSLFSLSTAHLPIPNRFLSARATIALDITACLRKVLSAKAVPQSPDRPGMAPGGGYAEPLPAAAGRDGHCEMDTANLL